MKSFGKKARERISNTVIYTILILITVVWLIPFAAIFIESFRVESTGLAGYIIPKKWGFDNYIKLFKGTSDVNFTRWYLNTLVIGIVTSAVSCIFIFFTSYALSRLRFKGRRLFMNILLILGMFPGFITMLVLYNVLKSMGMTQANAPIGLILVYVSSSAMSYYVSKGYFDTIPKSLDEAARIDGATRLEVFTKIILPMAKPIVVYTVLVGFMAPWGDFMFAKYIARTDILGMNVAVGMQNMLSAQTIDARYTMFCAASVVVAIPITLLFMLLQKYYVEGVTGGAVKG